MTMISPPCTIAIADRHALIRIDRRADWAAFWRLHGREILQAIALHADRFTAHHGDRLVGARAMPLHGLYVAIEVFAPTAKSPRL